MSISVGMVGLGMFGPSFIQSYKAHPDVHRLALCDLHADRLSKWAKEFEISETYSSLDDICKSDLDALVIITQHWMHAQQAIQAMEAGSMFTLLFRLQYHWMNVNNWSEQLNGLV